MAKSLRSKWRRKCRAVKRERYGVKELARLKKTLGIDENAPADAEMKEISEIAIVVDAKKIKEEKNAKIEKNETEPIEVEPMDEDGKRVYNKKTMKDQFGNYPIWMNKRRIAKHKKGRGKSLKSTTKSNKRLTRKDKIQMKRSQKSSTQQSNAVGEVQTK